MLRDNFAGRDHGGSGWNDSRATTAFAIIALVAALLAIICTVASFGEICVGFRCQTHIDPGLAALAAAASVWAVGSGILSLLFSIRGEAARFIGMRRQDRGGAVPDGGAQDDDPILRL